MKAVAWHGKRDVRVDNVPDPIIEEPTDAIVRITSSGICGSDLHLYEVLGPFMGEGDILGHEPMGIVEEVGSAVTNLAPGDRVVMPFQISGGDPASSSLSRSRAGTASWASRTSRRSARPPRSASTGWARCSTATRSS